VPTIGLPLPADLAWLPRLLMVKVPVCVLLPKPLTRA
jgi:hypothetical protein